MKNVTITELTADDDIWFDQDIDTDTTIASDGAIAVDGDVEDSAFNTGYNSGVIAGDDCRLDDSIVGNGNRQINDSTVGAYAEHGDAQNIEAYGNVNTGSGDLIDVDAHGDAQVVTGNGNESPVTSSSNLHEVDGPVNLAVGDGNHQKALEDNSVTNYEDSYNTDNSVEDTFNTQFEDSFNTKFRGQRHRHDLDGGGLVQLECRGQRLAVSSRGRRRSRTTRATATTTPGSQEVNEMDLDIEAWGDDNDTTMEFDG